MCQTCYNKLELAIHNNNICQECNDLVNLCLKCTNCYNGKN